MLRGRGRPQPHALRVGDAVGADLTVGDRSTGRFFNPQRCDELVEEQVLAAPLPAPLPDHPPQSRHRLTGGVTAGQYGFFLAAA